MLSITLHSVYYYQPLNQGTVLTYLDTCPPHNVIASSKSFVCIPGDLWLVCQHVLTVQGNISYLALHRLWINIIMNL